MAPGKSIMFQWEATPPWVHLQKKKNENTKLKGWGGELGPEGLWGGRLGRGECDLNLSSGILRELIKRNKQAINTQENGTLS